MGQISMEIIRLPGSLLSGNQQGLGSWMYCIPAWSLRNGLGSHYCQQGRSGISAQWLLWRT